MFFANLMAIIKVYFSYKCKQHEYNNSVSATPQIFSAGIQNFTSQNIPHLQYNYACYV